MHKKLIPTTVIPITINIVLIFLLIWIWLVYNPQAAIETPDQSTSAADWNPGVINKPGIGSADQFVAMERRPLFHQTRKPAVLQVERKPMPVNNGVQLNDLQLKGIVYKGKQRNVAYIYNRRDSTDHRVQEGDKVSGWHIEQIRRNEIQLTGPNQQSGTLTLFANTNNH